MHKNTMRSAMQSQICRSRCQHTDGIPLKKDINDASLTPGGAEHLFLPPQLLLSFAPP
jgi:hypothetical protein